MIGMKACKRLKNCHWLLPHDNELNLMDVTKTGGDGHMGGGLDILIQTQSLSSTAGKPGDGCVRETLKGVKVLIVFFFLLSNSKLACYSLNNTNK